MNLHPLTEDFRMYYANTYVFSMSEGEPRAMYVHGTSRVGDDRDPGGVELVGTTYNAQGRVIGDTAWRASQIDIIRPPSGYYDLFGHGQRQDYVTFTVANRTNRKGIDPRTLLINGQQAEVPGASFSRLYAQALEMNSRPGYRDFFITEENSVFYKGFSVGELNSEGKFVANQENKPKEALIWHLLQNS